MNAEYGQLHSDDRIVAQFLLRYHQIWQRHFPDLIKRAHWHTIFSARCSPEGGVSCRALHRVLYGAYGTDIRTCIERVKECEKGGFVRILDAAGKPCAVSAACSIGGTERLHEHFDRHCAETFVEIRAVFDGDGTTTGAGCGDAEIGAIFRFFGDYDRKWRDTSHAVVKSKGLTKAYADDAMDHLVTYQYWAIVMFLWVANASRGPGERTALVIDEINSKMWDVLQLGHLAIKERVDNLIRWGFFDERTIRKHKAVSLTQVAAAAVSRSLSETLPLLRELHGRLAADNTAGRLAAIGH